MAETLIEADLRDFWFKALLKILYAVPPQERTAAKWHMSLSTWMMLRDIFKPDLWPERSDGPDLLFGKPVEFVEQDGVTFHD